MRLQIDWRSEEGSVLTLTAISLITLIAFAGLAIDVGNARSARRHLQAAVDAAALAAALEVSTCGSTNCAAMQTAAQSALTENGFSGSSVVTNCAAASGSGLTVKVNYPPCALGASDPNAGNLSYVEVVASTPQPTYFAGVVGLTSFTIAARAEAKKTPNPDCIFALDPSGGGAISVDLLATVTSSCGVMDESSAANALTCNLVAYLTAPQVNVVGGAQGLLCLPTTTPRTGAAVPSPSDPLSALPKPTIPACGTSLISPFHGFTGQLTIVGNATLYPDASYCGGIVIASTANVTFMPGTYVIKSGGLLGLQGGLSINLLSNVTGTGVTFYNYGPVGGVNMVAPVASLGSVRLTAPTSGTYACILFFQDPGNSTAAYIVGSPSWNTYLQGAYYFPSANLQYDASLATDYNILVAKDIEFLALTVGSTTLTSVFGNNYASVPAGCPVAGGGSVLVQ